MASRLPRTRRVLLVLRFLGPVLGLLLVLALIALHTSPVRRFVNERIAAVLARQHVSFSARSLHYNVLAGSVTLQDVRVGPTTWREAPVFATIRRARIDLNLFQLLRGRYVIQSGTVEDVEVHYFVDEQGRDNLPRPSAGPDTLREPRSVSPAQSRTLHVASFSIARTRVRYENRAQRIDARLPIEAIEISGDNTENRHRIRFDAAGGEVRIRDRPATIDRVQCRATLGHDDVSIERLDVDTSGSRLGITGTITQFGAPVAELMMTSRVDVLDVASLTGIAEPVSGSVGIEAAARGPVSAPVVTAHLSGSALQFRDLRDLQLDVKAAYDRSTGLAEVSAMDVRAPSGRIAASGRVAFNESGQSAVSATVAEIDAETLMRALQLPVVAATQLNGTLQAEWQGMDYLRASGTADAVLSPTAPDAARSAVPLTGRVVGRINGGRIETQLVRMSVPGAEVNGVVEVRSDHQLRGKVMARSADVGQLISSFESMTGQPGGPLTRVPIRGGVNVDALIAGSLDAPLATAALAVPALDVGIASGIAVGAEASYAAGTVTISRGELSWHGARARFDGRVGIRRDESIALSIIAEELSVESLLHAMNRPGLALAGMLTGKADVRGTMARPNAVITAEGTHLVAYGEAIGSLEANVFLDGHEVTVSDLVVDKPQPGQSGRLTASGTYDLERQTYTFDLQSRGLQLLGVVLPSGHRLRGDVEQFAARGAGSLDFPQGSLDLEIAALEIEASGHTSPLGRVVVTGEATNGHATIMAAADHLSLDANATLGLTNPWPATLALRARALDLAALPFHAVFDTAPETLAGLQGQLRGTIDASAILHDPLRGHAAFAIESLGGTWNGRSFTVTSPSPLQYANERLTVDALRIEGADTSVTVRGDLPLADRTASGEMAIDLRGTLATLTQYAPSDANISGDGAVTLTGTLRGTLAQIEPDLTLTVDDGHLFSPLLQPGFSNIVLRARIDGGVADVSQFDANWGTATLKVSGRAPLDTVPRLPVHVPPEHEPATLRAVISELDPSSIPGVPAQLKGRLTAEAELTAARADLDSLDGHISFRELDVTFGGVGLAQSQPTTIGIASGTATLEPLNLSGSAGTISAGGRIGLDGTRALDLAVDGTLNIAALSLLTTRIRTEGDSTLKLVARGTLAAPELTGTIDLKDGTAVSNEPRIAAENIDAHLDIAGRRISLTRFQADVNGGMVSASGAVTLAERTIRDINLDVSVTDMALDEPLDIRSLSDASLRVSRAGDTILVKGSVTIEEAGQTNDVRLDAGLLARMGARRDRNLGQRQDPLLDRLRFDISVATATPLLVDNNLARAEITADLHVVGTPYEPGLLGSLTLLDGSEILLNERRYHAERGVITFADERRILPTFDLRLGTRAGDYDVTVTVTGTPGNTETTLTSVPSLPQPDIMARLVTGRTLDEARGEEFDIARDQVLSSLAGRLGSSLGRGLQQATGFSQVRIEPILIANEADPAARLTVGQNLTHDLKVVYSTNLADSNDQIWVLEYELTRRFQARAVWEDDGSYRVDLRRDVRFGGRPEPVSRERVRPRIRDVSVSVDGSDESAVRDRFGVKVGAPYDFFEIRNGIQRVEEWLIERGYLQSRVRLERQVDAREARLRLQVVTGPQVEMVVMGASPPRRVERALREQWQRAAFDAQRGEGARETLFEWLMDDNYLQATVEYAIENVGERQRRVVFQVDPGPRSRRIVLAFEGASAIHPDELDRIILDQKLERQLFTDPSVVVEILQGYYRARGHLNARIGEPRIEFPDETARVVLPIDEGPAFTVGMITISGNTVYDTRDLVSQAPLIAGAPFVPAAAENTFATIRDLYWAKGYNDVHVDYELVTNRVAGEVDVRFAIVEGRQSVISDISITGNDRVSDHLVRAQMQLSPAEPLDVSALARSRRSLYRTGAFSFVDITRREVEDANADPQKQVHLDVDIKELPPVQLRYGVSYDTERGIGGILDVSNRSSLGGAREVGIRSRYDGQLTDVRVFVNQPELTYRYETTASLYFREELNPPTDLTDPFDVSRKGVSIQQQRRLQHRSIWTYGYKYERAQTLTPTPAGAIDEAVTVSPVTSTLTRETRDVVLDASRGSFLSQSIAFSPSWLGSDQPYVKYFGQYFHYFPLEAQRQDPFTSVSIRPRLVFATGVRLGLAAGIGGDVPRTERFFAGGSATLRGFEQNTVGPITPERFALGGESLLVLNNEVRVPLISVVDGVFFTDIGNVFDRVSSFSLTNLRQSAGLGLRVRTAWLLLRADYGVVLDPRPGERRGLFYLSVGQAF
jgi:outer membrane protein assembly complex protein YaeT